jgi:phosphoserine phosphatase RsbU/P
VMLSLADVSGHGIGPALLMAVCRAYARSGFAASSSLQKGLGQLNVLLSGDLPGDRFVTYVAVLLNPVQSEIELTSAGHGPLLLYRAATDQFETIEAQGIPLGLFPGYPYEAPRKYVLEPGDRLTLLTDGFMEWTNSQDEEFGLSRLQESLRTSRSLPAAEAISNLYADVRRFAGSTSQADDLTAVILQRKGINS